MSFFKDIDGEAAIVIQNGVFKQVPLATRNGFLFVKIGGGYARLKVDGSTSKNGLRLEEISWNGDLYRDKIGNLAAHKTSHTVALEGSKAKQILLSQS